MDSMHFYVSFVNKSKCILIAIDVFESRDTSEKLRFSSMKK